MPLILPRRAVLSGLVAAPALLSTRIRAEATFSAPAFGLGVAAGDMTTDGFVLWTRLAPDPTKAHGGVPMKPIVVDWQVATDRGFKNVVAKGQETAWPEFGHSIHAEVAGLRPATDYFYRFSLAGETSMAGTVRTLPRPDAMPRLLRYAAVGCQHLEMGWYNGYRDCAQQPLDFVYHYGDYIYEKGVADFPPGAQASSKYAKLKIVRRYSSVEPFSLDDYRLRYADTKTDPDLQAAHAAAGWYTTYDDHEVSNNWASVYDETGDPPAIFVERRRAALQAWWENMPVRKAILDPATGLVDFHARVDYGRLARFHYPDTRLYRSDQPCGDNFKPDCAERHRPEQDMLNPAQWSWLEEGLQTSGQRWNVVNQQVMVAIPDRRAADATTPEYNMDSWGGYPAAQAKLLGLFADHKPGNLLVVTGDEHRNFANDLVLNDKVVASEFVSSSITSNGDLADDDRGPAILANNPFVKWLNDQRGYVLVTMTPDGVTGDYRTVETVSLKDSPVASKAKWSLAAGKAGLVRG